MGYDFIVLVVGDVSMNGVVMEKVNRIVGKRIRLGWVKWLKLREKVKCYGFIG